MTETALKLEVGSSVVHVTDAAGARSDSEPVLLLHAATSSGAQWRGVQRALGKRYRLLMPDLLADGLSTAELPSHGRRVLDAEMDLIRCVLDRAGGRAHVVGHSYGALLALRAALEHPEGVQSLLLLEPIAFDLLRAEGPRADLEEVERVRADCQEAIDKGEPERAAEGFVDYWGTAGAYRMLSTEQRAAAAISMTKVVLCWGAIIEGGLNYASISAPTTVVFGDGSPAPTRWIARRVAERLPNGRLVELRGAGHHAPLSHPAEVARELRQHVSWCDARQPPSAGDPRVTG